METQQVVFKIHINHLGDSTLALNCLPALALPEMTVNTAFVPMEHKYNTDYTDWYKIKRDNHNHSLLATGGKSSDEFQTPGQKHTLTSRMSH